VAWRRGDSCIVLQDASPIELERGNMACMALARLVRRLDNDFVESFRQAPMSVGAQEKSWRELWALRVSPMASFERVALHRGAPRRRMGTCAFAAKIGRGGVSVSLDELHTLSPERLVRETCLQVPIRSEFSS
jgi:hypothetical protein